MKIELTVPERLVVLGMLPSKANFLTHKALEKFAMEAGFDDDEHEEFGLKAVPGKDGTMNVTWDILKTEGVVKEVEFGSVAYDTIKKALKDLDGKGELEARHLSLYSKVIGEEE